MNLWHPNLNINMQNAHIKLLWDSSCPNLNTIRVKTKITTKYMFNCA